MSVFKMGSRILDTKDLITAIQIVSNYEGDLYVDGRLIMSCLKLSRAKNTQRLLEYGITSYVNQRSKSWNYRYTDPSKNLGNYYVNYYHYEWEGKHTINFTINEYRESEKDFMFTSLAGVMEFVRNQVACSPFQHNHEEDIYVSLHGPDGLISFAPADWQTEGEPEMFLLIREGQTQDYGVKHYMQKRFDQLQPKFGGYSLIPATEQSREMYEAGDVVMLETAVEGLEQDGLYLICEVDKTGDQTVFTIRDLDDYEVKAEVVTNMITIPKIGVMQ